MTTMRSIKRIIMSIMKPPVIFGEIWNRIMGAQFSLAYNCHKNVACVIDALKGASKCRTFWLQHYQRSHYCQKFVSQTDF